jgi:TolB-like protein
MYTSSTAWPLKELWIYTGLLMLALCLTACASSGPSSSPSAAVEWTPEQVAAAAAARAEATLAILPFTGAQGEDGETIAELFSFDERITSTFTIIPRTSINRAIRGEQGFQMTSGMTDSDTIAALGKQLGAKYVVAGTITQLGSHKLLIIAILHTEDLRQIAGDIQTYKSIEEIEGKLPEMARVITGALKMDTSSLPLLAVPPLQLAGGADSKEADMLAQILAVHLVQSGTYAVFPRTKSLEQVQEEYNNQFNGDTADEYLPRVGKGTNPRLVLSVTARRLGSLNKLNAAVINLETGVQEAGNSVDYQGIDDGMETMNMLALKLSGKKELVAQIEAKAEAEAKVKAEAKAEAEAEAKAEAARLNHTASDARSFTRAVAAINKDKAGGEYTITLKGNFNAAPVSFNESSAAKRITLKGDGTTRTIKNNGSTAFFTVSQGISFVLENGGTLDGNGKKASVVYVKSGGTFVMRKGATVWNAKGGSTIKRNGNNYNVGAGVFVAGTFTMEGGSVTGNAAGNWGGGVFVYSSGTFTIEGGSVTGNAAKYGGGVFVDSSGTFTMQGGEIIKNTASGNGGGVFMDDNSTFTMEGGSVTGNAASNGGGVFVDSSGTFTIEGGEISGNTASSGGGVYVDSSGRFTKSGGGTIDATNSAPNGKAVYVGDGKKRNSTAGPNVNMDSSVDGSAGGWE